jgi:hypothetical protein
MTSDFIWRTALHNCFKPAIPIHVREDLAPAATKKARNIWRASGWACPDFWQIFGKQLFEGECDGRQNSKYPHKYWGVLVGLGGLEPPTSPLSGARSSHLSYRPLELEWRLETT